MGLPNQRIKLQTSAAPSQTKTLSPDSAFCHEGRRREGRVGGDGRTFHLLACCIFPS